MLKRLVFSMFFFASGWVFAGETPLSRIAFGSGLRPDQPQPVWDALCDGGPELFIFMGNEARPAFQNFCATVPVVGVWKKADAEPFPPTQTGNYHAELYGTPGRRVQVILLDTRTFSSPLKRDETRLFPPRPYLPNTEPAATLLGRRQWNWLREQLLVPADVRLIVSSIPVLPTEQPEEKWANFPLERKNLFSMLKELNATGVIFLSGGRRYAEISKEDAGADYALYEITSSPLNGAERPQPADRNSRRIESVYNGNNFGLLMIDWDGIPPGVSLEIRDEKGHIRLQQIRAFRQLNISHGE